MTRYLKNALAIFCLLLIYSYLYAQNTSYWQQHVEYTMDVYIDVKTHKMNGEQTLKYTNSSPDTIKRVFYHLYFNAFQPGSMMDIRSRTISDPDYRVTDRISKLNQNEIGYHYINELTQNKISLNYKIEGSIMEVSLNEPIKPGQSTTFQMKFSSQIPKQIRRSGRNNKEGIAYSMTQWYPKICEYDDMGWHPNPYIGREFYGVWGNYDVKITINNEYIIAATGILQDENDMVHSTNKDQKTWHFIAKNVHDFAWAADPDYTHIKRNANSKLTLNFFYQKDIVALNAEKEKQDILKKQWVDLEEYTIRAFNYMNNHFGEYPYPQYSVAQGGDGGMEYPMLTLITGNRSFRSLVGVTVHELVHSWYHGVLATNESLYPWVDEGFTTYASALIMDNLFEDNTINPLENNYNGYYNFIKTGKEEPLSTHADFFHTNRAYSIGSYSKGAIFLHQLSYVVGKDDFLGGMKRYFNTWKFKHPRPNDFIRIMEKESDMILDWYLENWVHTTNEINYTILKPQKQKNATLITLVNKGTMPMPIDIQVTYKNGNTEWFYIPLQIMRGEKKNEYAAPRIILDDWKWTNAQYSFIIDTPLDKILSIEIDPSKRLADTDLQDNIFTQ